MQAAAVTWFLVTAASGAPWMDVPGRLSAVSEPWPSCAVTAAGLPALADFQEESIVRRRDAASRFPVVRLEPVAVPDSVQGLFEYSDGYMTRLDIHRVASYATLPLFVAQVVLGEVLLRNVESPPDWAKYTHGPIAGALAGLFVVNTVTGGLNLLEARRDPNVEGRALLHSMIMILADAGFVWTGLTVGKAGTVAPDGRIRTSHRKVALIAMGVATTGYLIMIPPFRQY